jgi:hypothetical protein
MYRYWRRKIEGGMFFHTLALADLLVRFGE